MGLTYVRALGYASASGISRYAYLVISTTPVLDLMYKLIHGFIVHRYMLFSHFVDLDPKSRNNAHKTLVFVLTNVDQSLAKIMGQTHLFLGLTCVIQALGKHCLKHTWLAHNLVYFGSYRSRLSESLRILVSFHSPIKQVAGGNLLKISRYQASKQIFAICLTKNSDRSEIHQFFLCLPHPLFCDNYTLEPHLKHLMCSKLGSRSQGGGECSSNKRVAQRSQRA